MSVITAEPSERESLECALLVCFPWGEDSSDNYKALLDLYVQARATEEGLALGRIDQRYRDRVWKDVCRMADERERRFYEMEHPGGILGEIVDYIFPPFDGSDSRR